MCIGTISDGLSKCYKMQQWIEESKEVMQQYATIGYHLIFMELGENEIKTQKMTHKVLKFKARIF